MTTDKPYDPFEHREINAPLTNCEAFISLLKCVIGTGILAMPLAFHYSGMLNGVILTIGTTLVLNYSMHLLIHGMTEAATRMEKPYSNFADTMAYAFTQGPGCCKFLAFPSGVFVNIVLGLSHYGICVVYIVFVATNLQQLIDYYYKKLHLGIYVAAIGVLLIPLFLIRHLKYLVPTNIIANIAVYTGFLCIFVYLFRDLPPITERAQFQTPLHLPLFFGIVLFAVTSVGLMLAIEAHMAKPKSYLGIFGILNIAMVLIVITNVAFAFVGYWRYGENIEASITLNVPKDEYVSQYVKFAIALSIFLTYPLVGFVVIDILLNTYILPKYQMKHPHFFEYGLRMLFLIITVANAVAFPNLGPLLALVGAFTISLLNLVFPAVIDLCLRFRSGYGRLKWILFKDLMLTFLGIVILSFGSYKAIEQIINEYSCR